MTDRSLSRWWGVWCVVWSLVISAPLHADVSAQENRAAEYLEAMIRALRQLNYDGTVVLLRNGKLETMRFIHTVDAQGQAQERLIALNSPLRELIRLPDNKVICVYPESKTAVVDHLPLHRSFLIEFPDALAPLAAHYAFEMQGEETVALLPAWVVLLRPRDDYRYARKFWLAKTHFLPLKYALLDAEARVLEEITFTELHLQNDAALMPAQHVEALLAANRPHHIHQLEPMPFERAQFELERLPPGFSKSFYTVRRLEPDGVQVEHLIVQDGLSSVSIYLEKAGERLPPKKSIGAINAVSRALDDYQITVMGNVPEATVQYIADGVRLRRHDD